MAHLPPVVPVVPAPVLVGEVVRGARQSSASASTGTLEMAAT